MCFFYTILELKYIHNYIELQIKNETKLFNLLSINLKLDISCHQVIWLADI